MNEKIIGSVSAGNLLVYEILEDGEFSVKIREVEHPEKFVSIDKSALHTLAKELSRIYTEITG